MVIGGGDVRGRENVRIQAILAVSSVSFFSRRVTQPNRTRTIAQSSCTDCVLCLHGFASESVANAHRLISSAMHSISGVYTLQLVEHREHQEDIAHREKPTAKAVDLIGQLITIFCISTVHNILYDTNTRCVQCPVWTVWCFVSFVGFYVIRMFVCFSCNFPHCV